MPRQIDIKGLWIFVNNAACAHSCGYCSTGRKKLESISFSRFERVVERFVEWRRRSGRPEFEIAFGIGHSYNYEASVLARLFEMRDAVDRKPCDRSLSLGGLDWRAEEEMRDWLNERKRVARIDRAHATLVGHGARHDRWNGRQGDFEFQMRTMQSAAELGLQLTQRLLVLRSTLPLLDALEERVRALPGESDTHYCLPYYRGFATKHQDERPTEQDRAEFAGHIAPPASAEETWRSEREWMQVLREAESSSHDVRLKLFLTDANIEAIETRSCEQVVDDLGARVSASYAAIPSREELRDRYGDPCDTKLYVDASDTEALWLDRYLKANPRTFERNLTHLWRDF